MENANKLKIAIGSDHAGFNLKEELKEYLIALGYDLTDFGVDNAEHPVDYPDIGFAIAKKVAKREFDRGILVCGTGLGMAIVANKVSGIRAAFCPDCILASFSRSHNDANILTLGGRVITPLNAKEIVRVWLEVPFSGERHLDRLKKIEVIEKEIRGG